MKLIITFCLVAAVVAAPATKVNYSQENVQLTRIENEGLGDGRYKFAYEQSDGTAREEEGEVLNEGKEDESIIVKGYYTWVGPDGVTYRISYIADDDGFRPEIEQGPGGTIPLEVIAAFSG